MRFFVVSLCTDMLCLSPVYHWLLASLGRRHRCSDFQYFSLTAKVCFSFEKISSVTWYLLIIQRCAWFALWILDACYPTLFILRCYVFCFSDRLIEIAGNRFPTYFDSEEKLFCMTRSIHLYRELTCDSVLKRYSFPEFKKKKKTILTGLFITVFVWYQSFVKSNLFFWRHFHVDNSTVSKVKLLWKDWHCSSHFIPYD